MYRNPNLLIHVLHCDYHNIRQIYESPSVANINIITSIRSSYPTIIL